MLEEVDFYKEAVNIESFRRYLEAMGLTRQATAPNVYHHCSTRRVLTLERLYGVPLTDLDSISSLVSNPESSLITALNVWYDICDSHVCKILWSVVDIFQGYVKCFHSLVWYLSAGLEVCLPVKPFMQMCMLAICGCYVMVGLDSLILVCINLFLLQLFSNTSAIFPRY